MGKASIYDGSTRWHIEAQEDVHYVIPLNFLQHLNTEHIHYSYEYLPYTLYKIEQNNRHKEVQNLREEDHQNSPNVSNGSYKNNQAYKKATNCNEKHKVQLK